MPFTDGVQEARGLVEAVEEANRNQDIGSELDPEYEQELVECRVEEEDEHPDFIQVNPEELRVDDNLNQVKKSIRGIELKSSDDLLLEARKLDNFQKRVLHIGIKFAHDTILARKGKILPPKAPLLMVHGGAGSGKSTVINVMSQYLHQILKKEGDDPECPYVLLAAFTGSAASNIQGQTLHTLFSFNFGSGYQSLSDKARDQKRNLYKNLKVLIIHEISLADTDMHYKIDLRLREITQKDMPFGSVMTQ